MKPLISSVRVRHGERHDVITVWSRGGNAGELTVDHGDGIDIADRLIGDDTPRETTVHGDPRHGGETVMRVVEAVPTRGGTWRDDP